MKRFRIFIKRLFVWQNMAPLLTITIAVIASLGVQPFGLQYTTDQIILALIAFLAIDGIVERLDVLKNLEENISDIRASVEPNLTASSFFKKRRYLPRMEEYIDRAFVEIWVAGITLNTMESLLTAFENLLRSGHKLRFLAPDPDGANFPAVSDYFRISMTSEVEDRLSRIHRRLKTVGKENVEIRIVDLVFPTGYFMMDPRHPKGKMVVQQYLYHISPDEVFLLM